jgi:putative oxidoreductase
VDALTPVKDRLPSLGLLILRLATGALLIYGHGWPKLMSYQERSARFSDPIGLGPAASFALVVFAETLCALLVMLGLFTRVSAVPLVLFFAVAAFIQHAADPFPRRELPMLFGAAYLALILTGPGRFSLDALRFNRGRKGG